MASALRSGWPLVLVVVQLITAGDAAGRAFLTPKVSLGLSAQVTHVNKTHHDDDIEVTQADIERAEKDAMKDTHEEQAKAEKEVEDDAKKAKHSSHKHESHDDESDTSVSQADIEKAEADALGKGASEEESEEQMIARASKEAMESSEHSSKEKKHSKGSDEDKSKDEQNESKEKEENSDEKKQVDEEEEKSKEDEKEKSQADEEEKSKEAEEETSKEEEEEKPEARTRKHLKSNAKISKKHVKHVESKLLTSHKSGKSQKKRSTKREARHTQKQESEEEMIERASRDSMKESEDSQETKESEDAEESSGKESKKSSDNGSKKATEHKAAAKKAAAVSSKESEEVEEVKATDKKFEAKLFHDLHKYQKVVKKQEKRMQTLEAKVQDIENRAEDEALEIKRLNKKLAAVHTKVVRAVKATPKHTVTVAVEKQIVGVKKQQKRVLRRTAEVTIAKKNANKKHQATTKVVAVKKSDKKGKALVAAVGKKGVNQKKATSKIGVAAKSGDKKKSGAVAKASPSDKLKAKMEKVWQKSMQATVDAKPAQAAVKAPKTHESLDTTKPTEKEAALLKSLLKAKDEDQDDDVDFAEFKEDDKEFDEKADAGEKLGLGEAAIEETETDSKPNAHKLFHAMVEDEEDKQESEIEEGSDAAIAVAAIGTKSSTRKVTKAPIAVAKVSAVPQSILHSSVQVASDARPWSQDIVGMEVSSKDVMQAEKDALAPDV